MKSIIIVLLLLGLNTVSFSQNGDGGNMKAIDLPGVVIKSVGKDFSVYLPDKNPDISVQKLQEKFIAYDLGKDYEGYESFLVIMEGDKGTLAATYNENGKLTRVVENYKDVRLPQEVIYSVYKSYPGWTIVNDKFLYTQEDGNVKDKEYNIKITKNNESLKLIVNPNGEILKAN